MHLLSYSVTGFAVSVASWQRGEAHKPGHQRPALWTPAGEVLDFISTWNPRGFLPRSAVTHPDTCSLAHASPLGVHQ